MTSLKTGIFIVTLNRGKFVPFKRLYKIKKPNFI